MLIAQIPALRVLAAHPEFAQLQGRDCVSEECCTSGLDGCLDSPLEITL